MLSAFLLMAEPSGGTSEAPPLVVTAEYLSTDPGDSCWKVTPKDPGVSSLMVCDEAQGNPRVIEVPRDRLIHLRESILNEHFSDLKDEYGAMPLDGPVSRIEVRLGNKVKRVSVFSIKAKMSKQEADEVDRAMRVWFAIQDCFRTPRKGSSS